MKFLLDANMPRSALQVIHLAGFQSLDVRDKGLGSAIDDRIDQFALQEDWILVTRDLDFPDIRSYPPEKHLEELIFDSMISQILMTL
jgi:predicted nuclease of predicted toxin-antitoxin system